MDLRQFGLSKDDLIELGYSVKSQGAPGPAQGPAGAATRPGTSDGSRWFWTVVALLSIAWGSALGRRLPDPVPANQPDTVFSSARAMSQLVEIARRAHPPGSPEHARVRGYLVERLRSLDLEPEVQTATFAVQEGRAATAATLRHILARVPGTGSTGAVAVMASYDASPHSPGAGDGGTGVAAILEVLRALSAAPPLRNDLIILLTDGAGVGLPGGRASLEAHPWMSDVQRVISVEMHGVSGPALTFFDGPGLEVPGPRPATSSLLKELLPTESLGMDWTGARVRGISPVHLVSVGGRETHHQVTDEAIRVSERTLQHHGMQILAMVRQHGRSDLGAASTTEVGQVDEAYFSVTAVGLLRHPVGWVGVLSLGLALGWLLVAALVWLRIGSYKAPLVGLAVAVLCVVGGWACGSGLQDVLRSMHPEYGHLETALFGDDGAFLALAAFVLALVVGIYANARRWFGPEELVIGALTVPVGFAIWMSFRAPFAAVAVQWPVALALCSALFLVLSGQWIRRGGLGWAVSLLLSGGILLVVVPHVELTASVLTFREAPRIGALIAMSLLLLLPTMEWLIRPSRSWTPATALLACLALVVLGLPSVQGERDHPTPSSLIYLVDDTLSGPAPAARLMAAAAESTPVPVRRVSGRWLLVPGVGESWSRSWVAEAASGSRDPGVLLVPQEDRWEVAGAGPDAELVPAALAVVERPRVEGQRRLDLVVRPGLGGEVVGIHLPGGGQLAGVEGTSLPADGSGPVKSLLHWGAAEQGTTTFAVHLGPDQETLEVVVLEHHLRPEELLGEGFFSRDGSFIPDPFTGSDRVVRRTRAVLDVSGAATPGRP